MAVNPNTTLPNLNSFYTAISGGGKSQAVKNQKLGTRVIVWDPDEDHSVKTRLYSVRSLVEFLKVHGKDAKFSVAYSGDNSVDAFELVCGAVWAVLDGKKRTDFIIEELADVVRSAGKAGVYSGQLIRRCRKYGGVLHPVTQRPAEVPKTIYTQCATKFIGMQEGADLKRMSEHAGVTPEELSKLKPLQFYKKVSGSEPELITFKFKQR